MHSSLTLFQSQAKKSLDHLHAEFSKLQTGRANSSLVEHLQIDCYGQKSDLRSVASISVQDASTIVIQPWDRSILGDIEKSLQKVDLGASPVNDGTVVRISLPPMTQERREKLVKIVNQLEEDAKISLRQHRHEAQSVIKEEADEDERERGLKDLQKLTDEFNAKIEESASQKTADVMKV